MTILQPRQDGLILTSDNATLSGVGGMREAFRQKAAVLAMATAIIGATADGASANFLDGNDLHKHCTNDPLIARAYITGVHDGVEKSITPGLCIPENTHNKQLLDIICNYLYKNPAYRHYTAASITVVALSEFWACRD